MKRFFCSCGNVRDFGVEVTDAVIAHPCADPACYMPGVMWVCRGFAIGFITDGEAVHTGVVQDGTAFRATFQVAPGGVELHTGGIMNPQDTWTGASIRSWLNDRSAREQGAELGVEAADGVELVLHKAVSLRALGRPVLVELYVRRDGERHHLVEMVHLPWRGGWPIASQP